MNIDIRLPLKNESRPRENGGQCILSTRKWALFVSFVVSLSTMKSSAHNLSKGGIMELGDGRWILGLI